MNSINLLPDYIKDEIEASKTNKGIFSVFISIFILAVIFFLFIFYSSSSLKSKVLNLDKEINIQEESVRTLGEIEKEATNLKGRLDAYKGINKEKVFWSKAVEEISANVPPKLYLTDIKSTNDSKTRGQITGNAEDKIAIASFINSLKKGGIFQFIDTESVIVIEDPFVDNRETNSFNLSFSLDLGRIK